MGQIKILDAHLLINSFDDVIRIYVNDRELSSLLESSLTHQQRWDGDVEIEDFGQVRFEIEQWEPTKE